jgi:alcohol dehydrogenase class IV
MSAEQVFTLEATPLKFGPGAAADAGWELARLGVKRALLVSDAGVRAAGITDHIRERIEAEGIVTEVWDTARVEPTRRLHMGRLVELNLWRQGEAERGLGRALPVGDRNPR